MMPDKVYVVPMKTSENQDAFVGLAYELDNLLIDKTEYIRKEVLLEWANSWLAFKRSGIVLDDGFSYAMEELIKKLNEI